MLRVCVCVNELAREIEGVRKGKKGKSERKKKKKEEICCFSNIYQVSKKTLATMQMATSSYVHTYIHI